MFEGNPFRERKVLVTGHTGFKGAWLSEWLISLGAKVTGLSLPPPTDPSLHDLLNLQSRLDHRSGDIRDFSLVEKLIKDLSPDFIFHLAAQPLVRASYREPLKTIETNVQGTANILEAVRLRGKPCVVVCITTDKCYRNQEWLNSYREQDPLGGYDPYSASKAAAEIIISGYQQSFFSQPEGNIKICSARAGNVIGGGDWAEDRIFPDCIRALQRGEPIKVRNPHATRPWQHVLEPLSGYLQLAALLSTSNSEAQRVMSAGNGFNFGPALQSNRNVRDLVSEILLHWPGNWIDASDPKAVHEAHLLNLATDKAYHLLHWQPTWDFNQTVAETVRWYRAVELEPDQAQALTLQQIEHYVQDAANKDVRWAV